MLDVFSAAGFNLIDTADVYSTWAPGNRGGESETILGEWLASRKNRDTVVIATKVGKPMGSDKKGLSKKYIHQAVEASLKRLQTSYIDLYQSHDDDPSVSMEETLGAFSDLIKEGKVRAIGASNFTVERLKKALDTSKANGYARYETFQPAYNLYDRNIEIEIQPLCLQEKIGIIPYYSLASGFLTGKYRGEQDLHKSVRGKGIQQYLNEKGRKILEALDLVASRYNASPATIALAWLISRPAVVAPLASATTVTQLSDLLKAAEINLDPEAMQVLSLEEPVGVS